MGRGAAEVKVKNQGGEGTLEKIGVGWLKFFSAPAIKYIKEVAFPTKKCYFSIDFKKIESFSS